MLLAFGVKLQAEEEGTFGLDLHTNTSGVDDDLESDRVLIMLCPDPHTILFYAAADAIRLLVVPQL